MPKPVVKSLRNAEKISLEKDLIDRACAGDQDAFADLHNKHFKKVFAVCFKMTHDRGLAEDCAQEAFISAFKANNLARFDRGSTFSTWIHRIAVNAVKQMWRKKRIKEVVLDEVMDTGTDDGLVIQQPGGHHRCPGDHVRDIGAQDVYVESTPNRLCLEKLLEELRKKSPSRCRAITLHDLAGLDYGEIARELGCSVGNLKSLRHFALKRLQEIAKDMEPASC